MNYLLDTNICVLLIRQKSPQVLARLTSYAITEVGVSTITVAELQYGVQKSSKPAQNQQTLNRLRAILYQSMAARMFPLTLQASL